MFISLMHTDLQTSVLLMLMHVFICRGDPLSNMRVDFMSQEDAIAFCEKNGEF